MILGRCKLSDNLIDFSLPMKKQSFYEQEWNTAIETDLSSKLPHTSVDIATAIARNQNKQNGSWDLSADDVTD